MQVQPQTVTAQETSSTGVAGLTTHLRTGNVKAGNQPQNLTDSLVMIKSAVAPFVLNFGEVSDNIPNLKQSL